MPIRSVRTRNNIAEAVANRARTLSKNLASAAAGQRKNLYNTFFSGVSAVSFIIFLILSQEVPSKQLYTPGSPYINIEKSLYANKFQTSLLLSTATAFPMLVDLLMDFYPIWSSAFTRFSSSNNKSNKAGDKNDKDDKNDGNIGERVHWVGRAVILLVLTLPNFMLYGSIYKDIVRVFVATEAFKQITVWCCIMRFVTLLDNRRSISAGSRKIISNLLGLLVVQKVLFFVAAVDVSSIGVILPCALFMLGIYCMYGVVSYRWLTALHHHYKEDGFIGADDVSVSIYLSSVLALIAQDIVLVSVFGGSFQNTSSCLTAYMALQTVFTVAVLMLPGRISRIKLEDAHRVMEARQEFIRYISHEIRSPLNTVTLGMSFIDSELRCLPDVSKEHTEPLCDMVKDMMTSCTAAVSVLDDLLTVDKIHTGRMQLELQEKDPHQFLTEVCNPYNVSARHKNITFILDFQQLKLPRARNFIFRIDEHKFSQVVRNLMSNAIKFTPEGGKVAVTVTVETYRVRSNGIMVKVDDREEIFGKTVRSVIAKGMVSFRIPGAGPSINANLKRFSQHVGGGVSFRRAGGGGGGVSAAVAGAGRNIVRSSVGTGAGRNVVRSSVHPQSSFVINDEVLGIGAHQNGDDGKEDAAADREEKKHSKDVRLRKVLRLEVKDSGAGISPENQKMMFRQYMQFNAGKLQKGNGSGLGLWISKGIVELHGGKIGVQSQGEGFGTTFFVQVPMFIRHKAGSFGGPSLLPLGEAAGVGDAVANLNRGSGSGSSSELGYDMLDVANGGGGGGGGATGAGGLGRPPRSLAGLSSSSSAAMQQQRDGSFLSVDGTTAAAATRGGAAPGSFSGVSNNIPRAVPSVDFYRGGKKKGGPSGRLLLQPQKSGADANTLSPQGMLRPERSVSGACFSSPGADMTGESTEMVHYTGGGGGGGGGLLAAGRRNSGSSINGNLSRSNGGLPQVQVLQQQQPVLLPQHPTSVLSVGSSPPAAAARNNNNCLLNRQFSANASLTSPHGSMVGSPLGGALQLGSARGASWAGGSNRKPSLIPASPRKPAAFSLQEQGSPASPLLTSGANSPVGFNNGTGTGSTVSFAAAAAAAAVAAAAGSNGSSSRGGTMTIFSAIMRAGGAGGGSTKITPMTVEQALTEEQSQLLQYDDVGDVGGGGGISTLTCTGSPKGTTGGRIVDAVNGTIGKLTSRLSVTDMTRMPLPMIEEMPGASTNAHTPEVTAKRAGAGAAASATAATTAATTAINSCQPYLPPHHLESAIKSLTERENGCSPPSLFPAVTTSNDRGTDSSATAADHHSCSLRALCATPSESPGAGNKHNFIPVKVGIATTTTTAATAAFADADNAKAATGSSSSSASAPTTAKTSKSATAAPALSSSLKFLIVDDSVPTRKMVSRILVSQKHTVVEAADGLVCVNTVQENMKSGDVPIDVVLMDDNMPNMSGPDAAKRLRELGYKGLIVAITGNVMDDDVASFKAHGADEVLPKPLDIKALQKCLMKLGVTMLQK